MRSLLLLLLRYGHVLLFLTLETFCFYLIVKNNDYQRSVLIHSSNMISGNLMDRVNSWKDYFRLQEINDSIAMENARLRERLLYFAQLDKIPVDTLLAKENSKLEIIPAKVINNSIQLINNYITLNKGKVDGVDKRMGVVARDGVIGVIEHVSDNFSTVLPFLNSRSRIRGMIRRNGAIGSVSWDGRSPNILIMEGIPKYLSVQQGDTILTSGYSTLFPEGYPIGIVTEVTLPRGSNTFVIKLRTPVSMAELKYVYIISNKDQQEQLELESLNQ